MPKLFQITTPDFEFSVSARDISSRVNTYEATLSRRRPHQVEGALQAEDVEMRQHPYRLLFSPALQLNEIEVLEEDPQELNEPIREYCFEQPLFFENTQYVFEYVFFGHVVYASMQHASQVLNDAFVFSSPRVLARNAIPARLTGTINTQNDVGWMALPLAYWVLNENNEKEQRKQTIAFEILPTKMDLHSELPAMYSLIDATYPLWRFSLVQKTSQEVARGNQVGDFPIMWLASFQSLREEFEAGLKVICESPHRRLNPNITHKKAARLKGRVPPKLLERVRQDFAHGRDDRPYRVEKKHLSADTPENRFVKMAVAVSKRQLAEIEEKLRRASSEAPTGNRLADAFLNEINEWQQPLQKALKQSFLRDVGHYSGLARESQVLQQKTGYRSVYRVWQDLKFYLDAIGSQSAISMKSVAKIYEVWCFLRLKQILLDLGFEDNGRDEPKLSQNKFLEYQLADGFHGSFKFIRSDSDVGTVTARLSHEPKFTKTTKQIRSYTANQEPDIFLEVNFHGRDGCEAGKQFVWIFDAKYRLRNNEENQFGQGHLISDQVDSVPDDAINQMHRYRDALIRLVDKGSAKPFKTRPVFGAFVLYPGYFEDQINQSNPYADSIEEVGVGAFPLLPSQVLGNGADQRNSGDKWLFDFLEAQLGSLSLQRDVASHEHAEIRDTDRPAEYEHAHQMHGLLNGQAALINQADRLYLRSAARIPDYGMRQLLYSDLVMIFQGIDDHDKQNMSHWLGDLEHNNVFRCPAQLISNRIDEAILEEVRYLVIAPRFDIKDHAKVTELELLPVISVCLENQAVPIDRRVLLNDLPNTEYYRFKCGKALRLKSCVWSGVRRDSEHSIWLTTLERLDAAGNLSDVVEVY